MGANLLDHKFDGMMNTRISNKESVFNIGQNGNAMGSFSEGNSTDINITDQFSEMLEKNTIKSNLGSLGDCNTILSMINLIEGTLYPNQFPDKPFVPMMQSK